MSNFPATLCWDCAKAAHDGCSWAESLKPVEGWEAVPTVKQQFRGEPLHSFLVISCPEFERDAYNGGTMWPKEYEDRHQVKNRNHH